MPSPVAPTGSGPTRAFPPLNAPAGLTRWRQPAPVTGDKLWSAALPLSLIHIFRRILLWQQQGIDVDEAMLSLSTYVGHAMVTNTYWYLQAVPELMAVAAQRFESCMPELSHA